jgi:hypothetical protein
MAIRWSIESVAAVLRVPLTNTLQSGLVHLSMAGGWGATTGEAQAVDSFSPLALFRLTTSQNADLRGQDPKRDQA